MCEKYGIDDKTRFLVLYFDAQMDVQEISKRINRSEKTMRYWESRIKIGEDIRIVKKGRGRKKTIPAEIENKIIQMINENAEGASLRKLAARINISRSSVARVLDQKGLKYKAIDRSIIYDEDEKMIRVDFCKRMLSEEGKLIYRSFFSDEMGVELNKGHKTKAWQVPTEKIRRKNVTEKIQLDCWGAISVQGSTSLEIYKKGINGNFFRQVIEQHKGEMEQLYPDGEFYLIQDGHPVHRMNEDWIRNEQKLNLIKLPTRSPDLNIIEHLWSALKERVASDAPTNEKELRASLMRNWETLTRPERLRQFFEGLQRRYKEYVEKEEE